MKEQILFSCVGTTDPARGDHDGGLLHILRHYRPSAVCLFLSAEMTRHEAKDHRFAKLLDHMKANWDGYAPEYTFVNAPVEDASDLDALDEPMGQALSAFTAAHPEAQILINLSSGTPQMQMLLAQMNFDLRFDTVGIQVKNPENKSGTTRRTNADDYDVDLELEMAEMVENEAGAENRCSEPRLFAMRREMQWQQVEALLEQRNYTAVAAMRGVLSEPSMRLVQHLAARNALQSAEAKKPLRGMQYPFALYPSKGSTGADYREVSEYYLMLKNLHHNRRYTDFVLRLNPLTVRLQESTLNKLLGQHYGVTVADLMEYTQKLRREQLTVNQMVRKVPEFYLQLNTKLGERGKGSFLDSDPSIFLYNVMLSCFDDAPSDLVSLFRACEKLNGRERNQAAHTLYGLSEDNVKEAAGMTCEQLVRRLEQAILALYPECDPALFNIYERCGDYICRHR